MSNSFTATASKDTESIGDGQGNEESGVGMQSSMPGLTEAHGFEHTSLETNLLPPPGPESGEEYHMEMHNVYLDAKLQFERAKAKLKLEKNVKGKNHTYDRKLEKKLKLELAAVKARVKKENADQQSTQYFVKEIEMDSDSDSDSEPCASIYIETSTQQHNVVEKWQRGHQKAALKAAQEGIVLAATVLTLRDARLRMATHG